MKSGKRFMAVDSSSMSGSINESVLYIDYTEFKNFEISYGKNIIINSGHIRFWVVCV